MNKTVEVVPYQPGDEPGIQTLFDDVFGLARSLDFWRWQFKDHPGGESWIFLAKEGEEVVGHFAFRRNHINFLGKEIVAGQACDAMIRGDRRREGLFTRLFVESNNAVEQKDLKILFGFPNRVSFPADMRKAGRHRIANLQYYYYRSGYRRIVGGFIDKIIKTYLSTKTRIARYLDKKLLPYSFTVKTANQLPQEAAEMLRECHNYEVLSLWKDLDYMKWRYEENPECTYLFHMLYVENRLEGLLVTRECGETVVICEFLHRSKDFRQSIILLRFLKSRYIRTPVQKIEFKGWDNGFFSYVFAKSGFSWSPSGLVFTAESLAGDRLDTMLPIPQNWTIVQGDMDVI